MADRYISEKSLIGEIVKIKDLRTLSTKTIGEAISNVPTADVVEVVRCRDCSHRNPCCHKCLRDNLWHDDEDFCSYGKRKEEG